MKKSVIFLIGLLIGVVILFSSCSDEEKIDAPDLPPIESILIDFSDFPQASSSGRVGLTKNNFGFAALNVVFWQSIINTQLAIPIASYYEAFNHDLTYLSDKQKWMSEYTVEAAGNSYTATLFASYIEDGDKVLWEMYLSSPGAFEDFLWYRGESSTNRTGGTWTLYTDPQDPREFMGIEWTRQNDVVVAAAYELVDSESDHEGSTINCNTGDSGGVISNPPSYDISILSKTEAEYDVFIRLYSGKSGLVKSMSYFQDEDWHCWDDNLDDIECENI